MKKRVKSGSIEAITGCMFAGKSEEVIRRVRRALLAKLKVQVFKPSLDTRYAAIEKIVSHNGLRLDAVPVQNARDILKLVKPDTELVAIDEAELFPNDLYKVLNELADKGLRVIVAGLDMDFRGEPFGPMPNVLAIAEKVDKLTAICVKCGMPATRSQRLINGKAAPYDTPVIHIGGKRSYEARCRHCHQVPGKNGKKAK